MTISLGEKIKKEKEKYGTLGNTYEMFPVGTRVQVITLGQDMIFFNGNEIGTVIRNSGNYLGIIVKFDEEYQKHYKSGYIMEEFNFKPEDLIILKYG